MKIISDLLRNSIYKGGIIFFIGGVITNILNYFYRILMGRMLGPELFGELIVTISLVLILAVPSAPLQTAAARFSAIYQAQDSLKSIKQVFRYLTKIMSIIGLGLIILTLVFASQIQSFLNLSSINYVYFLAGISIVMLVAGITKGILQGLKKFSHLSAAFVLESVGRIILAVILVFLGYKVAGALAGFLVSLILGYFLTIYFLKDIIKKPSSHQNELEVGHEIKEVWQYVLLSFLGFLFLNILLNIDIILVKHYFSSFNAGIYSALATLGRIVFLLISLLAGIIFPVVVFKQEKNQNYFHSLKKAMFISLLIGGFICLFFFLFSEQFILLFFGSEYLDGTLSLGYYSLAMTLFGFIFLLSYFFMALNKFKFLYVLAIGSILEVVLIILWHESFLQIISMFSIAFTFTLVGLGFLIFLQKRALLYNIKK